MHDSMVELWPTDFLKHNQSRRKNSNGHDSTALIILNSPISDVDYLKKLYSNAGFCVCADGGANRLHDLLVASCDEHSRVDALMSVRPNLIHGDLDSISPMVRERYESIGVDISQNEDKYSTDFGKTIKQVVAKIPQVREILVLGSIGGRLDQGIGLLHELLREQKFRHPQIRFWFFSESSVTVMLRPGTTLIHTPLKEGLIECNIGILPVYGPAVISTTGLEWDVQEWRTEMGGQVSTSNHIVADQVQVSTDIEILFTVERSRRSSKPY